MTFEQGLLVGCLVLLAVVLVWATAVYVRFYKKQHFVCPECGHAWKPPVARMVFFSVNAVEGKIIRCPACGKKVYVEPVDDRPDHVLK